MIDRKRNKTENFAQMLDVLADQLQDINRAKRYLDLVPSGWNHVAGLTPIKPPRTKLAPKPDADMVKRFRSLGRGWHPRVNAVLRAYMHAVIANAVEEAKAGGGGGR